MNRIECIGRKFNKWTILSSTTAIQNGVTAKCECGTEKIVDFQNIRKGLSKSCGCARLGRSYVRHYQISPKNEKTYRAWVNMNARCGKRKTAACWKNYGGRGIRVCERWKGSFPNFLSDMGVCPEGHTIERKDVNGGYHPQNCIWLPEEEQPHNTTKTVFVEWGGERLCAVLMCAKYGVSYDAFCAKRIRSGWSAEKVFQHYLDKIKAGKFRPKSTTSAC